MLSLVVVCFQACHRSPRAPFCCFWTFDLRLYQHIGKPLLIISYISFRFQSAIQCSAHALPASSLKMLRFQYRNMFRCFMPAMFWGCLHSQECRTEPSSHGQRSPLLPALLSLSIQQQVRLCSQHLRPGHSLDVLVADAEPGQLLGPICCACHGVGGGT